MEKWDKFRKGSLKLLPCQYSRIERYDDLPKQIIDNYSQNVRHETSCQVKNRKISGT